MLIKEKMLLLKQNKLFIVLFLPISVKDET